MIPAFPKIAQYREEYNPEAHSEIYRELVRLRAELNKRVAGTYTPTITNGANLDATTAYPCQYIRVENVVTVSGQVDADPTAAVATQFRITLPIASNFTSGYHCAGTAVIGGVAGLSAAISAETTNKQAQFNYIANDTTNRSFFFSFTYQIL